MNQISTDMLFDGWSPVIRTLVLGTLAYVALVILLRASGKRTLSKMNAFDFVITVAFGSTLASIMTSSNVSLVQGVLGLALLIVLQFFSTFMSVRFDWYKQFIKAQPTLLFFRGEYLVDAMKRQRITREEILAAMRQHGITKPSQVDAVVIETEGSLSVLKNDASSRDTLADLGVEVESSDNRTMERPRSVTSHG